MDKNVIEGKAKQVIGVVKQKTGELIKDRDLEVEGVAQRVEGKVQEGVGKAKDAVRKLID